MVVYAGNLEGAAQDPNLSLYCSQVGRSDLLRWSSLDSVLVNGAKVARWQDIIEERFSTVNAQCLRAQYLDDSDRAGWLKEFRQIVSLASSWPFWINVKQVSFALQLAEENPRRAFELIVRLLRSSLAEYGSFFSSVLHFLSGIKTSFLRLLCSPYSIRNLITAQRRWYLHHGSHPDDSLQPA